MFFKHFYVFAKVSHKSATIKNFRNLSTKLSYIHQLGEEPLLPLTIGQMFDTSTEKYWKNEAIISCHEKQSLTFSQVKEKVDKLASGFLSIGLQKGDRLGIWGANHIQWYITFFAAAKAGLILVTLNPMYQAPEIEYCLQKVGIKVLILDHTLKNQNNYNILREVVPELEKSNSRMLKSTKLPNLRNIIILSNDKLKGTFRLNDIYNSVDFTSNQKLSVLEKNISMDDPFNIQFTSGTTGKPKATIITHHNLTNNSYHFGKLAGFKEKHHKICIQVPFFHAFGTDCSLLGPLPFGATIVLPNPMYSPTKNLEALKNEKCTVIYGTPSMYTDLIKIQKEKKENIYLETLITGGAPCSPHLFKEMKNFLNVRTIKSVYGLTEVTGIAFQSRPDEDDYTMMSTVGRVMDHIEVKVVNEKGKIVPFGTPGELCVRGYSTMLGYWEDEQKTREVLGTDKWLKTGTAVYFDSCL